MRDWPRMQMLNLTRDLSAKDSTIQICRWWNETELILPDKKVRQFKEKVMRNGNLLQITNKHSNCTRKEKKMLFFQDN